MAPERVHYVMILLRNLKQEDLIFSDRYNLSLCNVSGRGRGLSQELVCVCVRAVHIHV